MSSTNVVTVCLFNSGVIRPTSYSILPTALRFSVSGYNNRSVSSVVKYNDATELFHFSMVFQDTNMEWKVANKDLSQGMLAMILMTSSDIANVTIRFIAPTLEYDQLHPDVSKAVQKLVSPSK